MPKFVYCHAVLSWNSMRQISTGTQFFFLKPCYYTDKFSREKKSTEYTYIRHFQVELGIRAPFCVTAQLPNSMDFVLGLRHFSFYVYHISIGTLATGICLYHHCLQHRFHLTRPKAPNVVGQACLITTSESDLQYPTEHGLSTLSPPCLDSNS